MNTQTAISVENLGKSYILNHRKSEVKSYVALRDVLTNNLKNFVSNPKSLLQRNITPNKSIEEFWALKDISFDVKAGDKVGIIGRNGAGKSTLLKILSRITEPTSGHARIKGRMASLLEVGTGFHPELTGRENIYLNGCILGMSREEINNKFDQIVEFAEIEKFLDTPVKRYSSGMYVRLAFSIAAHLEPDILIVDEVLAVGDIAFQKKCMLHMSDVGASGRTLLFVSHNIGAVQQLCNSVICLNQGLLVDHSYDVTATVRSYMSGLSSDSLMQWHRIDGQYDNEWFAPISFYIGDVHGNVEKYNFKGVSDKFFVYIKGLCEKTDPAVQVGIAVYGENGELIFWSFSSDDQESWPTIDIGHNILRVEIPSYFLNEGNYRIDLGISLYRRYWMCEPGKSSPSISLELRGGFLGSSYWTEKRIGLLAPKFAWERWS